MPRSLLAALTLPSLLVACAGARPPGTAVGGEETASTTTPTAAASTEPAADAPATKAAKQAVAVLSAPDVLAGQAARMAVYEFGEPDYRLPAGLGRALKVLGDPASDASARRVLGRAILEEAPASGVAAQCHAGKQALVAALDAKREAARETLLAQCTFPEALGKDGRSASTTEGLLAIVAIGAYLDARGAVAPEERKLLAFVARLGAE